VSKPIRVLALSPIPEEGAGCRFRIAQFIPYLESVGISVTLNSLFTPEFFRRVGKRFEERMRGYQAIDAQTKAKGKSKVKLNLTT